jgi:hypothetical protein
MFALRAAKLAYPVAVLCLMACLAGCNHLVELGASHTLRIALGEYRLNPQSVHAQAGTLTIMARNYGRLTHNLVLSRSGQIQGTTRALAPGQWGEITAKLTPGTYQLASMVLSDQALGAYGTLTVTS